MSETEIDDNVFEYTTGGMRQNISNFAHNQQVEILDRINADESSGDCRITQETIELMEYSFGELVRWCQGLNQRAREATAEVARLREALGVFSNPKNWKEVTIAGGAADYTFDHNAEPYFNGEPFNRAARDMVPPDTTEEQS